MPSSQDVSLYVLCVVLRAMDIPRVVVTHNDPIALRSDVQLSELNLSA